MKSTSTIFTLALLTTSLSSFLQPQTINRWHKISNFAQSIADTETTQIRKLPKVIIFDLDGCLWRPEMYELLYFSGGRGAPFTTDPSNPMQLRTIGNEPVYTLGDVKEIFQDLHQEAKGRFEGIQIGISSRTDEPDWARELLQKFQIDNTTMEQIVSLGDIFRNSGGPIEIAKDSKVEHFFRICETCGVEMEEILFFDNELGNCRQVATLGVTVAYCPDGVTSRDWNYALDEGFPRKDGKVLGVDC
jgi:magnesium-dependent phosphatase 1